MGKKRAIKALAGELFAVPLEDGRFAGALVARVSEGKMWGGHMMLVYTFERAFDTCPTPEDVCAMTVFDTMHVGVHLDDLFKQGHIIRLGLRPDFVPGEWPFPPRAKYVTHSVQERTTDAARQRVLVSSEKTFVCNNVPNDGLVDPVRHLDLPIAFGFGFNDALVGSLSLAFREPAPHLTHRVTPEVLKTWAEVTERARQRGLVPE